MTAPRRRAGFVLAEVLWVMAMLGAIAAILLTAVGPARRSARATVCMSHLRQIGMVYKLYVADYGYYPRPSAVTQGQYIQDRRILFCAEDVTLAEIGAASSYRYRYKVPPDFRPLPELKDLHPDTVLTTCGHHAGRQGTAMRGRRVTILAWPYPYHLVLRADGHVKRVHEREIGEFFVPGSQLAVMDAYPGEPGYRGRGG